MSWYNPASWFGTGNSSNRQPDPYGTGSPYSVPGPARGGLLGWLRQSVGPWPGPQQAQDVAPLVERAVRDEKMAGGPRGVVFPHFLPYFDDNYTHETTAMRLAYRQMLADPNVSAALRGMILAVAGLDLQIQPADKKNARDKHVADFVKWNLTERLAGVVPQMVWSILSGGLIDGYSVCEKVWTLQDRGKWEGKYVLRELKPKDVNNDLVLQTDAFKNVIGIMGLRYNGGIEFSPADFLIYRHLPLYGSPTGLSALRCVYNRFWMLDTVMKLRAVAAEKRAIPATVGKYGNASVKASLEAALVKLKSQFWTSVPKETEVEILEMAGAADEIYENFARCLREEIFLGIQMATLQSLTGGPGEQRGNSQVHKDSKEQGVWYLASTVEALLNDRDAGLIRDMVDLNFVVSEYPRATLSAVDVNELVQELAVDQGLAGIGMKLSKEATYERYGRVPPESPDDVLAPEQQPPGGGSSPGGGSAPPSPFVDTNAATAPPKLLTEGAAARPFRRLDRFSESWQRYLAG